MVSNPLLIEIDQVLRHVTSFRKHETG